MVRESGARVTIRPSRVPGFGHGEGGRTGRSTPRKLKSANSILSVIFISVADQRRKAELHCTLWVQRTLTVSRPWLVKFIGLREVQLGRTMSLSPALAGLTVTARFACSTFIASNSFENNV